VNEATNTHIERTPESRCVEVTAPNGSGRDRGRTLDCSALTPDETHHAPSHRRAGSHRVRMEAWQGRFILDSRSFGPYVDLDKGGLLMEAIWPRSKPYRLGALLRPSGIFAGRSGRPTPKKSPYITRNKRTCRALVWKALLSEKSSVRRGQRERSPIDQGR
jgi:hypothetical protein